MLIVILAFISVSWSLVWYLLRHDHGRKLQVGTLWGAFGFGILAAVAAMLLEYFLLPRTFSQSPIGTSMTTRFGSSIAVGFIEEAVKFLPLAFFIYKKPYFRERTDGVIYFAVCGLTFGLLENILYTIALGATAGIGRLILTPFFHAASTSILGYYLASYKIDKHTRPKFYLALVLLPLIHGTYDFGIFSGNGLLLIVSLMLTALLTMGLFLYFMRANELDRISLITAAPATNFCPFCGHPNTHHTRFCESCGRQL